MLFRSATRETRGTVTTSARSGCDGIEKTISLYTNHFRDNRLDEPSLIYPGFIEPKVGHGKLWETNLQVLYNRGT